MLSTGKSPTNQWTGNLLSSKKCTVSLHSYFNTHRKKNRKSSLKVCYLQSSWTDSLMCHTALSGTLSTILRNGTTAPKSQGYKNVFSVLQTELYKGHWKEHSLDFTNFCQTQLQSEDSRSATTTPKKNLFSILIPKWACWHFHVVD